MNETSITSKERVTREITRLANIDGLDLIEAVVEFADKHDMDMEDVVPLLDRSMRERIRIDAIRHRYVLKEKSPRRLPL